MFGQRVYCMVVTTVIWSTSYIVALNFITTALHFMQLVDHHCSHSYAGTIFRHHDVKYCKPFQINKLQWQNLRHIFSQIIRRECFVTEGGSYGKACTDNTNFMYLCFEPYKHCFTLYAAAWWSVLSSLYLRYLTLKFLSIKVGLATWKSSRSKSFTTKYFDQKIGTSFL